MSNQRNGVVYVLKMNKGKDEDLQPITLNKKYVHLF